MLGVGINVATVLLGGALGLLLGGRVAQRLRDTVMQGLGLCVLVIGALSALETADVLALIVSCVLGGFLGNFLERLWHGWVLDMIYFPFLPWFVCNVADIAICAGVALLAGSLLFRPQDWKEA